MPLDTILQRTFSVVKGGIFFSVYPQIAPIIADEA